jgi:hypothetical protein
MLRAERLWWRHDVVTRPSRKRRSFGHRSLTARWLQTRPAEPLPSLRLTFYINAFACASLTAFVSLPRLALRSRSKAPSSTSAEEKQPMVSSGVASDVGAVSTELQVCVYLHIHLHRVC